MMVSAGLHGHSALDSPAARGTPTEWRHLTNWPPFLLMESKTAVPVRVITLMLTAT